MVSREMEVLGFAYPSDASLRKAVAGETAGVVHPAKDFDGAYVYQDPSGPRATIFVRGNEFTACPGFAAESTVQSSIFQVSTFVTGVELRRAADGEVFNQVAAASDEAFILPAGSPGRKLRAEAQLTGIVTHGEIFPDEDSWRASQEAAAAEGKASLGTPAFLFSPSLETFYSDMDATRVGPYGLLTGRIHSSERRTNRLTGQEFYLAKIAIPAGLLNVVMSPELGEPKEGAIVDGKVFFSVSAGYWDMALRRF